MFSCFANQIDTYEMAEKQLEYLNKLEINKLYVIDEFMKK